MRFLNLATFALAVVALAACSGSEKTAPEVPSPAPAPVATEQPPANSVAPQTDMTAPPNFDQPNRSAQASALTDNTALASTPQPERSTFRIPADAIGGSNLGPSTMDLALRGRAALDKHLDDAGIAKDSYYHKLPVEQRDGYWTMTFFGYPPTHPDGMYVEVRVFADGSAEVLR